MKIYIPPLKTKLVLTKDWRFTMFDEDRNKDLAISLGIKENKPGRYGWIDCDGKAIDDVVCPAGTVLMVDRIYIRNGAKDFDSVTFRVLNEGIGPTDARWKGARFWAKLLDVNTMECEVFSAAPALSKKDAVLVQAAKDNAWIWHAGNNWNPPILMRVSRVDFEEDPNDPKIYGHDVDGNEKVTVMVLGYGKNYEEVRMEAVQANRLSSKVRIVKDLAKAKLEYAEGIKRVQEWHRNRA